MSSSHNHTGTNANESGEIKLLVCSGNLGNAQPDEASWNQWVPLDGYCSQVTEAPPYPLRRIDSVRFQRTTTESDDENDYGYDEENEEQFHLIIFGMQESTFDKVEGVAASGSDDGMNESARSVVKTITKKSNKISSALQTLSTSRDYLSKEPTRLSMVTSPTAVEKQWMGGTLALHALMAERLPSYERVVSFQRGEMRLEILAHQARTTVEVIHVTAQNTGRAGLANKGGIVAELLVNGRTRLSFVTAHLEAHEGLSKYQTRVSTMADILSGTKQQYHDCSQTAHYSFVMGDLNFRSELPNHAELDEEEHKQIVRDMVLRKDWDALNRIDELQRALKHKECLVGYQTLFCNFPPTFKVERQLGYEYIDKRRPSYTDRVLWKTNHGLDTHLRPLVYEPIDQFTSSDHKPIRAAFAVQLVEPFLLRPKMVRRRSALNMNRLLVKKKGRKSNVSHKERFHLFVADMSCVVFTKGKSATLPNPYICLVTDPPEALQQPVLKGWRRIQQEINKNIVMKKGERRTMTSFLTSKGFPRSSAQKQTTSADWGYEEIHAEVTTHTPDGAPINLSGALLHFTVMDYRSSTSDAVIGSFSFNMAALIQSRRPSTDKSGGFGKAKSPGTSRAFSQGDDRPRTNRRMSLMNVFGKKSDLHDDHDASDLDPVETSGGTEQRRRPNRRMSLMNVFGMKSDMNDDSEPKEEDPIETIQIDEPILKSGVETGRIKFKLEAWWMDEWTRKAFGDRSASTGFFTSDRGRKIEAAHGAESNSRFPRRHGQILQPN